MPRKMIGLRVLRQAHKETQADVARILGKSVVTIARYEKGLSRPSDEDLKVLAEHYGVRIEDLYIPDPTVTADLLWA